MRVALVEDEEKLARTLKKGLESEGYRVDLFFHGETAETHLALCPNIYDLFLFDLTLPGRDGFEICTCLRNKGITTPVLILTARTSREDKVRLLDAGADDFMSKPFDFDELLARMRALLRRPHHTLPPELTFLDLTLSPKTHEVYRAGKPVSLTSKEFELLHYLLRNQGRVVSREELLTYIWGTQAISTSNILDAQVKNLREKIDHAYDKKLLATIRGVGFALRE